jgi:hypothetical protein
MSDYESDYEDPYKNYSRLKETYDYLYSLAMGRGDRLPNGPASTSLWRGCQPPAAWFAQHIEHIKAYLDVLEATDDRDQRPTDLMRDMIGEFSRERRFNLKHYLLVCARLIELIGDIQLEEELAAMGVSG